MLYEEEDIVAIAFCISLRGNESTHRFKHVRSCYTQEQLEELAPDLTMAEWELVRAGRPTARVRRLIQQRIDAAHTLKLRHYGGDSE